MAQLANYDFVVKYRPGKENGNADALSWRPKKAQPHTMAVGAEKDEPLRHIKGFSRKMLTPYNKCWAQLRVKYGLLLKLGEEGESN